MADLSRAIEIDSTPSRAFASRGLAYEGMGREKDALADYHRAIELEPGLSEILGGLSGLVGG
jgi:Tfp pilus assembly protein PilF